MRCLPGEQQLAAPCIAKHAAHTGWQPSHWNCNRLVTCLPHPHQCYKAGFCVLLQMVPQKQPERSHYEEQRQLSLLQSRSGRRLAVWVTGLAVLLGLQRTMLSKSALPLHRALPTQLRLLQVCCYCQTSVSSVQQVRSALQRHSHWQ